MPTIAIADKGWEVRSGLELNVGPNLPQTLNELDKITITYGEGTPETFAGSDDNPLSIKTNYLCQSTLSEIDITEPTDFAIEPFTKNEIVVSYSKAGQAYTEPLPLNNFGNNWTKMSFSAFDQTKTGTDVNTKLFAKIGSGQYEIGSGQYGLLMIY